MVTELPTPKFSTTVPAAPAILNVTLPLPAITLSVNVIPILTPLLALVTKVSFTSG